MRTLCAEETHSKNMALAIEYSLIKCHTKPLHTYAECLSYTSKPRLEHIQTSNVMSEIDMKTT